MLELRISESITLAYFAFFALAALVRPVGSRARARVLAFAALAIVVTLLLAREDLPEPWAIARDWLPVLWLIVGYWIPRDLIVRTHAGLERWLVAADRRLFATGAWRALVDGPRVLHEALELCYLCVYPMVPAALGVVLAWGGRGEVDRFWTLVLAAEFLCYACLPIAATRPPRELEGPPRGPSAVRRLNLLVLGRASNHWNTFPSGHVAGAVAIAAALVLAVPTAAAAPFVGLAVGIAVGSVTGRYHYVADAVAGVVVAIGVAVVAGR